MEHHIDESWYVHDDSRHSKQISLWMEQQKEYTTTMLSNQEKIIASLHSIEESQQKLCKDIRLLSKEVDTMKQVVQPQLQLDIRTINTSLHELHVLRQREVNAMIREHIPFRFTEYPFTIKRPFSSYQKKDSRDA